MLKNFFFYTRENIIKLTQLLLGYYSAESTTKNEVESCRDVQFMGIVKQQQKKKIKHKLMEKL